VLRWIIDRCENRVTGIETPIGILPKPADIDVSGLNITKETMQTLFSINTKQWIEEMDSVGEYLQGFGNRLPDDLWQAHQQVVDDLQKTETTNF
jgi:phosphoenolpyruvate carboxykinase (GTP)